MSMARVAGTGFRIDGEPELPPQESPITLVRMVGPGYFETLGVPISRGREFSAADPGQNAPPVFLVNEAFATTFLATRNPLDTSLSVFMQRPDNPFGAIVGVVGDVKDGSLRGAAEPTVFYSDARLPSPGMTLLIRAERGRALAQEAIAVIRGMDANVPVTQVRMLEDAFAETVARDRVNAVLSVAFGLCALLLASLGLYALLGHSVAERTNEIGIRMALGARAAMVLRMVVAHGIRVVALGAALGLGVAFLLSGFLESQLYGVSARDPATFTGVLAVVLLVSLVAMCMPAHRATRVDPMVALRND
jgi:putative ABC transport system permease protein